MADHAIQTSGIHSLQIHPGHVHPGCGIWERKIRAFLGLALHHPSPAQATDHLLERVRWQLWDGQTFEDGDVVR